MWRQRTEDTIMSLTENSAKVADDLQQSAKIQDIIVQNQLQTLEYQVDAQNWSGRLNGCVAGINWTWGIFQMPSVLKVVFLSLAKGRADLGITIVAVSLDQSIFPY